MQEIIKMKKKRKSFRLRKIHSFYYSLWSTIAIFLYYSLFSLCVFFMFFSFSSSFSFIFGTSVNLLMWYHVEYINNENFIRAIKKKNAGKFICFKKECISSKIFMFFGQSLTNRKKFRQSIQSIYIFFF